MEKPHGPRQPPPDKRHAAYESIFGRPGATHHQYPIGPNNYPHYAAPSPQAGPSFSPLPPQGYHSPSNSERQSHHPSLSGGGGYNPSPHNSYYVPPQRHSHGYEPSPVDSQASFQQFSPYPYYVAPYQQGPVSSTSLAPPSNPALSRARSMNGYAGSPEYYNSSRPSLHEPPNSAAPGPYGGNGLTPAQAYQAQVYQNGPKPHPNGPRDFSAQRPSPAPSDRMLQKQNGGLGPSDSVPSIGLTLDHDDGRLGVDFGLNSALSDHGLDDDSSELPWAKPDSPAQPRHKMPSQHTRQPSGSEPHVPPLHVDTSAPPPSVTSLPTTTSPSSLESSAASTTLLDHSIHSHPSSRYSTDSSRTLARLPSNRRDHRTSQDRSMSMSAASNSARPLFDHNNSTNKRGSRPPVSSIHEAGRSSPTSVRTTVRKTPVVYPALLSRVAQAFRDRIPITDRVKDGLTYKDAFDGREAVDKIAYIIKTTDRNLALLLGRALDAQKFFHDVTYDHRLRDSSNELYRFRTKLPSPFVSGEMAEIDHTNDKSLLGGTPSRGDNGSPSPPTPPPQNSKDETNEIALPSGVFTLLTDCYSPTCSRDQLCYSIACPRRMEQQARLNMKPQPGLSKQISRESLNDVAVDDGSLWIHSVPQEIVNSISEQEKRRQEAINEVIYTERDFVRDMEYLRDVWINRLKEDDAIPPERRTDFLAQVFWNIHDIIAVNTRLRDALSKRQKAYVVVDRIGDIFLEHAPHFGPFVSYGAHQLYGKYEFEKEKSSNPAFALFVEHAERLPESRKLELNAYLTKPTTRLARYPLLLEAVLKQTPADSQDKTTLPNVINIIRGFLGKVNTESGKTENRFNLVQLDQQLYFKPGEELKLRLTDEGREMIYKGTLSKRDGELNVFLLDHALLFTKYVKTKQSEQYKVYRRPIPLELLLVTSSLDEAQNGTGRLAQQRRNQALVRRSSFERERERNRNMPGVVPSVTVKNDGRGTFWINFVHLGRKFYNLMLWANTPISHQKWLEVIDKQQHAMRERSMVFDTITLSEGFFLGPNKVNCAAPYSGGRRIVYGTDDGVYLSDLREANQDPVKVLALLDVMQVDVLEDYQLLIVLSERQVITFPLDALDPLDPMAGLRRAKRISSHTSFFKAGFCLGRVLVCIVKSSQLSSTFKTLEPIDQNIRGRAKPTFKKLLQGGNDTLKPFREFYIPVESTSIHYLKTRLCIGCSRGFEIVDLETLDTQGLLDPTDESLEFVRKRDNLRPMAIYRIHNEFLLCYDEFAFYVNKNGRRARKDFMIYWEGVPTGFALHEPYVLALEQAFVEIRHIETGLMTQVIQGSNLRLLFADTPPSVTNHHHPQQNPYGYNPYAPHPQQHHADQHPRHPQGVGRDEILIVSDDRVLAVRPVAHGSQQQRYAADNSSMISIPR